jgi:distribution and morphology protein 34
MPQNRISPRSENNASSLSGGILEQAWMLKMAQEIARKVQEEKLRDMSGQGGRGDDRLHHPQPQSSKAAAAAAGGMWATGPESPELEAPPAYQA